MTGVDLADEDAKFMQYLADNGWHGEVGEDDDKKLITRTSSKAGGSEEGTYDRDRKE